MENEREAAMEALKQSFQDEKAGRAFRQRRSLPIGKSVVALVLVLVAACGIGVVGYGAVYVKQTFDVAGAVNTFCEREVKQDYAGAYQMLSAHLQSEISPADFANDSQQAQISSCTYEGWPGWFDLTKSPVVVPVIITAASIPGRQGGVGFGNFFLVYEGSAWRIDGVGTQMFALA